MYIEQVYYIFFLQIQVSSYSLIPFNCEMKYCIEYIHYYIHQLDI